MIPPLPGVDFAKIRDGVSGAGLSIKVGSDIAFRGFAVCKDAKSAEEVKAQAEALRSFLMEQMKKAPTTAVPKEILDLPGKVKFATKGNLAEATLTVKEDVVITIVKLWFRSPDAPPPPPAVEKKP